MIPKPRLFTPGPTMPLPQAAQAEAAPMPHHRSPEFRALLGRVQRGLRAFFNTRQDVVVLTCSGTGGMEAACAAAIQPGLPVVVVNGGRFGARWLEIARALGAQTREIRVAPGQPVDPADVKRALDAGPACAVLVQGCETSTATLHPVREIAALVRPRPETLMCVDGITWLGAHEVRPDEWGIDLLVGASQKALSMAPGLAFVGVSEKAAKALEAGRGAPRYYLDLRRELAAQRQQETAFTPAVSLVAALDAALQRVTEVGHDNLVANAACFAAMSRAAVQALGLKLVSSRPADSVTAVYAPEGITAGELISRLQSRHGVSLANGQDELRNLVFRLAHLGFYDYIDAVGVIAALEDVLLDHGLKVAPGTALAAAQQEYRKRSPRVTGVPPG